VTIDRLAAARALFETDPTVAHLDAASYGLPPRPALQRMAAITERWAHGDVDWELFDTYGEPARSDFAALIGASADEVALIATMSIGVGLVAAALPAEAEVVLAADEYSAVILPMLVAAQARGVHVREVPFAGLVDAVGPETTLVAVSVPQMHTGAVVDLAGLVEACRAVGARLLIDASQGVPFVDFAPSIAGIDYIVAAGYKHLLSPRGSAFLYVRRDRWADLPAWNANFRASDEAAGAFWLGGPLLLRPTAARFDTSPDWLSWIGAAESLRLIRGWTEDGSIEEVGGLAARLADGLGLPAPRSSLVCLPVSEPDRAAEALGRAGVRAAIRVGHVRLAPHVWTTDADVDRAVEALRPWHRRGA
jgi:selenocysteine lyase/cysteine desulfurase